MRLQMRSRTKYGSLLQCSLYQCLLYQCWGADQDHRPRHIEA
jgi:hypothetical protein